MKKRITGFMERLQSVMATPRCTHCKAPADMQHQTYCHLARS